MTKKERVKYYICGSNVFSLICSQLWSGCDLLAYLFTNPPINPLLTPLPTLHYNNLLPGDKPFCFLGCVLAYATCQGYGLIDLSICRSIINIDNLIRMSFDIALLLFTVFAFVPGFCDYFPFVVNLWMLPKLRISTKDQL